MPDAPDMPADAPSSPSAAPVSAADFLSRSFITTAAVPLLGAFGGVPLDKLLVIAGVIAVYMVTHCAVTIVKIQHGIAVKN